MNNQINNDKSILIFQEMIKGRIINDKNYDFKTKEYITNDLFIELRTNYSVYSTIYASLGFKIIDKQNFFYAANLDSDENSLSYDKKGQKTILIISLLLLTRYVTNNLGLSFESMINPNYGFSMTDFSNIMEIEEFSVTLNNLDKNIKSIFALLVDKNIITVSKDAKTVEDKKYILSSSGIVLIKTIISKHS